MNDLTGERIGFVVTGSFCFPPHSQRRQSSGQPGQS